MKKYLLSTLALAFSTVMFAQSPFSAVLGLQLSSDLGFADENVTLVEGSMYTSGYETGDSQKNMTITNPSQNVKLYALTGFSNFAYAGMLATNSLDGVQLGFLANTDETDYKITFKTVVGSQYYLIDKLLGTSTAITLLNGEYPFTTDAGSQIDNRFEIRALNEVPGMTLTAHEDPDVAGDFYCTFFHSGRDFKLPAGTEAYVATASLEALNLVKVANAGQVIPKGVAFILKANSNTIELANADATAVSITAANDLLGKDYESAVPANCYVFSGHSTTYDVTGIGFYEFEGAKLGANKAYVILNTGSNPAPKRLPFVFAGEQGTTAIDNTNAEFKSIKTIENGALIIEKNGVRYNAMGQMVK